MKRRGLEGIAALWLCGALAGCGKTEPTPAASEPVPQAAAAAATQAPAHPLCDLATLAEVQAVIGGRVQQRDVIDEPSLPTVDCVFLDADDLYNALTLRIVTTERLQGANSQWPSAQAYFDEWSRNGQAVAGLGEGAAWIELPAGLLVRSGAHAYHLSTGKLDMADLQVRSRLEELARRVVTRG